MRSPLAVPPRRDDRSMNSTPLGGSAGRGRWVAIAAGCGHRQPLTRPPSGPPSLGSFADVLLRNWKPERFALASCVAVVVALAVASAAPVAIAQEGAGDVVADEHPDAEDRRDGEHVDGEHADAPPLLSLDIGSAFWNLVIFLAVLAVLGKFVWPNVLGGLKSREEKIREDLESSEKANAKAASLLAEYQKKLDEASTQVQSMLAEARRDAEASGQRIVDEAKQEADRQRERALGDIETAKQVAVSEIADQASELAMRVARSVVGRELNPSDHADLIRQSLDRLPEHQ